VRRTDADVYADDIRRTGFTAYADTPATLEQSYGDTPE
jgi:hypothetical protein